MKLKSFNINKPKNIAQIATKQMEAAVKFTL
jgi:hypothetical protein